MRVLVHWFAEINKVWSNINERESVKEKLKFSTDSNKSNEVSNVRMEMKLINLVHKGNNILY